MGKHTKLPALPRRQSKPKTTALDPDALLQTWIARLERMIGTAELLIENGQAAPTVLREASGVARAIVALSAEMRQREKQAAAQYDRLSEQAVLGFLRETATHRERINIHRELALLIEGGKRSGLA